MPKCLTLVDLQEKAFTIDLCIMEDQEYDQQFKKRIFNPHQYNEYNYNNNHSNNHNNKKYEPMDIDHIVKVESGC
jgi:hypothetical protein